ncbi:uncharacterized protein Dmoj_GI26195, isoform B [Drosophila mojavensis]|uniref:Uncharacterized protein, isoform B n=1 Tax=Drosophila mojavensis TaxID=7230 RepID=A0A0Q9XEH7_DROMO|nr:uncharacterized protein Dmoj_GI26195, isoform B [Drosophila mojavensis]
MKLVSLLLACLIALLSQLSTNDLVQASPADKLAIKEPWNHENNSTTHKPPYKISDDI